MRPALSMVLRVAAAFESCNPILGGRRVQREIHQAHFDGNRGGNPQATRTKTHFAAKGTRRGAAIGLLQKLGPGLIRGASDDDPSGIATYSQVGARFGYGLLWIMVFTLISVERCYC
ncbi:MAG: divalent metal cation transporter [Candidatus Sulfotelmatobacter sp.]|nr:divalent metal cation transporter [Candidatus Sulfotelmatobacter sp.]